MIDWAFPVTSAPHRSTREVEVFEDEVLASGTVIADRYRVETKIGSGGMGAVYLAEHLTVGRQVAIKVLSHRWSENDEVAGRFRAEARAASTAGHPNIVQVFDAGELPDGRLFLVMEHLRGDTVLQQIEREGPMDVQRCCEIGLQVARAIAAAHAHGVIHRDLKAENVMIIEHPDARIVKVLDFGVAVGVDTADTSRLTRPGLVVGTPETMAPEQARGCEPTIKFDIYALGCLLFECLTGRPPFVADNPLLIVADKLKQPAPPVGSLRTGLPLSLERLVDGCLASEPDLRPATAADVCERLRDIVDELARRPRLSVVTDGAAEARPEEEAEEDIEALLPRRRWPWWVSAVAVVGVVLAGGVWLASDGVERAVSDSRGGAVETSTAPRPMAQATAERDPSAADPAVLAARKRPARTETPEAEAEPEPEAEAEAEAEPSATTRAASGRAHPSDGSADRCKSTRRAVARARRLHRWEAVLRHAARRRCWKDGRERRKLRVQALKELKRFDQCAREGATLADPKVQRWVRLCELRAEQGDGT